MSLQGRIGFLGYGNMGSAILEGLIERGVVTGKSVYVYDADPARLEQVKRLGVNVADSPAALAEQSDFLVLAVKPQQMEDALKQVKAGVRTESLIISVAAGLPIRFFEKHLGTDLRIVRVMPNTPSLVHAGAAGIALGPNCHQQDGVIVQTIFEAVGISVVVEEAAIDAVTAVSGSGPAYFFYLVECLIKAGVEQGLEEQTARRLASQTLLGAGRLLQSSGDTPRSLRDKVTSPGGTTAAALKQMEEDDFAGVVRRAVKAAAERSRELGS